VPKVVKISSLLIVVKKLLAKPDTSFYLDTAYRSYYDILLLFRDMSCLVCVRT